MAKNKTVMVQDTEIHITEKNDEDYISLSDIVSNSEEGTTLIDLWLRDKETIEFIGEWEKINNSNFNFSAFEEIKNQAGSNRFTLSAKKWMQRTQGTGIIVKGGRYGGVFAHTDIAFEFASWLNPKFKLYLIKEFNRLKSKENKTEQLEWNIRRTLTKANYRIHTDAIKTNLIPPKIPKDRIGLIYATEADLLNMALFGKTAKQWRIENPALSKNGNIRDEATTEQLVVLASLESQNALLIQQGKTKDERVEILNQEAIRQMKALLDNPSIKKLEGGKLLN